LEISAYIAARFAVIALIIFAYAIFNTSSQAAVRKIIFDTDPGTDDAMALMLALNSPELDVRAITVVPGNVTAEQGLENALRMVSCESLRYTGCGRCAASAISKINHGGILAREKWAGEYRIAAQQMQSGPTLWT
jgi:hypothetical protein